jgi:hypothetical protein
LFRASALPTILMVNHNIRGGMARRVDELVNQVMGFANVLLLCPKGPDLELYVPSLPGHPTLSFPNTALGNLVTFLHACAISHVHVHHWIGFGADLHELVDRLGVPFDLTVHDWNSIESVINIADHFGFENAYKKTVGEPLFTKRRS